MTVERSKRRSLLALTFIAKKKKLPWMHRLFERAVFSNENRMMCGERTQKKNIQVPDRN